MQKETKEMPQSEMQEFTQWGRGVRKEETAALEKYQINLSDFALFLSVMKVKEAYEDVLSIILDEPELKLKEVRVEQVILNKSGKRAIRLDAWAQDECDRQFDMEMQNDTEQDDVFGRDLAMYTFTERCEEVPELSLEDGTCKIFLNMTSKNGRAELISLLQYMKYTTLDNSNVTVKDERILHLDQIVNEVKQSEEWEAVEMNIFEIGVERGKELGMEQGQLTTLVRSVELYVKNFHMDLQEACKGLEISVEDYEKAKRQIARWENGNAGGEKRGEDFEG